ncbi:MAG: HNH endonuclease [Peptococcaceae bacterium]|nr:HNH endonuclease [Peptococcaceae bacterium]
MLPFDRYEGGGRKLLGRPPGGDGTCRRGYGVPVFKQCGLTCVYCGRFLGAPYEAWLDISIDHVIPRSAIEQLGVPREWVEDVANLVTCCRACNEFLNQYRVNPPAPQNLAQFFDLRDQVFRDKRELARRRHAEERMWYEKNVKNG